MAPVASAPTGSRPRGVAAPGRTVHHAGVGSASDAPRAATVRRAAAEGASKLDRRSARSQHLLREALAELINEGEDLTRITVGSLADRAGLTRRTFYTHYRDIPDLVEQVEAGILAEIRARIASVAATDLDGLYRNIDELEPAPGSVELLAYLKRDGSIIGALLGPCGDPAFAQRIMAIARETVAGRMQTGIFPGVLGTFFDYYLAYVVAAEMGIICRWFETGLVESPETMARIMTVVAFVRPGDLYSKPIDINVPEFGMKLLGLQVRGAQGGTAQPEEEN